MRQASSSLGSQWTRDVGPWGFCPINRSMIIWPRPWPLGTHILPTLPPGPAPRAHSSQGPRLVSLLRALCHQGLAACQPLSPLIRPTPGGSFFSLHFLIIWCFGQTTKSPATESLPVTGYKISVLTQMVEKLPARQETWVQSLGWDDPPEKGSSSTPVFFPGKSHGHRSLAGNSPCGHKESDMTEQLTHIHTHTHTHTHTCWSVYGLGEIDEVILGKYNLPHCPQFIWKSTLF